MTADIRLYDGGPGNVAITTAAGRVSAGPAGSGAPQRAQRRCRHGGGARTRCGRRAGRASAPWQASPARRGGSSSRARAGACGSTTTTPTTPRRCAPPWRRRGPWRAATRCTSSSSRTCSPGPGSLPQEFADALNAADTALVLDIYPAREDPIPGVTSALIAEHLGAGGAWSQAATTAVEALAAAAQPGDIILTAGAGDVTAYGPLIVESLEWLAPAGPPTGPVQARRPGPGRPGHAPTGSSCRPGRSRVRSPAGGTAGRDHRRQGRARKHGAGEGQQRRRRRQHRSREACATAGSGRAARPSWRRPRPGTRKPRTSSDTRR